MVRLLQIPDYLDKWELAFDLIDGWEDRGADLPEMPSIFIAHHTGGISQAAAGGNDYPSLATVRDGRSGPNPLAGPLSQIGLGFSGRVKVIAAGKANHAGPGAWAGITQSIKCMGCEAESPGTGLWTPEQRAAYPRVAAAMLDMMKQPSSMAAAHREWALPIGRKPDPKGFDMTAFRNDVQKILKTGSTPPPPVLEDIDYPEEEMVLLENDDAGHWFAVRLDLTAKKSIADSATLTQLQAEPTLYKTVGISVRQLNAIPTVR